MRELEHTELRWTCDLKGNSSKVPVSLEDVVSQEQFTSSFEIGIKIKDYNLYVADFNFADSDEVIESLIRRFDEKEVPGDIIYVNDFDSSAVKKIIHLPKGYACRIEKQLSDLKNELSSLEQDIRNKTTAKLDAKFATLQKDAEKNGIHVEMIDGTFTYNPINHSGSAEEQKILKAQIREFHETYTANFTDNVVPKVLEGKGFDVFVKDKMQAKLDSKIAKLKKKYVDLDDVVGFLDSVAKNLFRSTEQSDEHKQDYFSSLEINVLVDNSRLKNAPIVFENSPSYFTLFGHSQMREFKGNDEAHFEPGKFCAGSLFKANGGYLVFDIEELFKHPSGQFTYVTLMNVLSTGKLKLMANTPAGINTNEVDLDVKVILTGHSHLHWALYEQDSLFNDLFKTCAEFSKTVENTKSAQQKYASYLKRFSKEKSLLPLADSGCEAILEYAVQVSGNKCKLSTDIDDLTDLLKESEVLAVKSDKKSIGRLEIENGILSNFRRKSIAYEQEKDFIKNYSLLRFDGTEIGQINGLTVMCCGDFKYGAPERITACVGVGEDGVIYPDVEANLAGEILTKSTHIIDAYLIGKYCEEKPLKLSARITFEQCYGQSDGDSASSTSIYALLSALSKVPLKQSIAVTGSVDKSGNIQVIGGVNQKIEGFYDACKENGLTGVQGVMIPQKNIDDLMLRLDVVESVKKGEFHIYPVNTIDEGLEILTGKPAKEIHKLVDGEILRLGLAYKQFEK